MTPLRLGKVNANSTAETELSYSGWIQAMQGCSVDMGQLILAAKVLGSHLAPKL